MKKAVLLLIIAGIVFSCIYPPWQSIYGIRSSNIKRFNSAGYGFLFKPPSNVDTIDFGRLGIQIGLLLFLGSCVIFSKYIFPPTKPKAPVALDGDAQ